MIFVGKIFAAENEPTRFRSTGVVEITIMEILSPNVLQAMHCIRDERGYTQMRDTTMRVDNMSFITSATASSGSKEVVGPISAV